jgi:hypothetical protein
MGGCYYIQKRRAELSRISAPPLWDLLIAIVFLRNREEINRRTVAGTVCVVVALWQSHGANKPKEC